MAVSCHQNGRNNPGWRERLLFAVVSLGTPIVPCLRHPAFEKAAGASWIVRPADHVLPSSPLTRTVRFVRPRVGLTNTKAAPSLSGLSRLWRAW